MPEILFPRIGFDQIGPVAKIFDRAFELRTARQHDRCADLTGKLHFTVTAEGDPLRIVYLNESARVAFGCDAPALAALDEIDPEKRMDFECETVVGFGEALPDVFGSADLIGRIGNRAIVLDWKFGDGVPVDVEENPQLLFYTAAAMRTPECRWAFEGVEEI